MIGGRWGRILLGFVGLVGLLLPDVARAAGLCTAAATEDGRLRILH